MTKTEKEALILERILYLQELDNVGCYGYFYLGLLYDIIAEVAFKCPHNKAGETIYPADAVEYNKIMSKIDTVIGNMVAKGIIRLSKSKKMFKLNAD